MVDVTDATFEVEILAKSDDVPVVVDLWAEWCGPCRTLGPILERVIGETDGQVVLAKVDTDANPQLSQSFQVQGIPAVFAIRDRKIVDQFVGAQPESVVREFVQRLLPSDTDLHLEALLAAGDEESLRSVLELVPDHHDALVALAEILVSDGRGPAALELLAKIPESAETRRVGAMARTGPDLGDDDIDAALAELLPQVRDDDDARQRYVDLLELLGPDDQRTAEHRKALSRQLF